jgi:riboflavin kinase/FMN adenylyltransferase
VRTLVGFEALAPPASGTSVTIGTFDGVHIGHRALIGRAVAEARRHGLRAAVVTWDRHPNETLRPERVPPLLTTARRKAELIEEAGADVLVILPFDTELSQWEPRRFAADVLKRGLAARRVFVGEGWRFGRGAVGDPALLRELGNELGFTAEAVRLAHVGGAAVSSTRVRLAVASGDMEVAGDLLGRPFDLEGVVVHGDDRGAKLGFPTANVAIDAKLARPPLGVYAARARASTTWFKAAVNVGVNPTFGGDASIIPPRLEAYLIDFDGDLYGAPLRIEFLKRLRDEMAFDSAEGLVAQIAKDVEAAKALSW